MKTVFKLLLCFILICLLLNPAVWARQTQPSGSGTESDPYRISTRDHLLWISEDESRWDKHFLQVADINAGGMFWQPIGNNAVKFTGSYDGQGFMVMNMYISSAHANFNGFFGFIENASIKNIFLKDVYISAGANTGGLAGASSNSNIKNIKVSGQLFSTHNNVGGLLGWISGGLVHFVSAEVNVSGAGSTGGLIGAMQGGTELRHSYSKGIVTGTSNVGGLTGYVTTSSTIISDCYSHADVSANSDAGGLIGHHHYGVIYRSYSKGAVDCSGSNAGGLIGRSSWGSVHYSYWDIEASGQENSAGGAGAMGRTTAQMHQEATYKPFNFYSLWRISEGHDYAYFQDLGVYGPPEEVELSSLSGSGSESDPYIITDIDQLNAIRKDPGAYYRLNNDIDMKSTVVWDFGRGWGSVGATDDRFTGGFDGNSKTLTGLVINRLWASYQGMFGYIDGAEIKDIVLMSSYIIGAAYTGSLTGYAANSTIRNISSETCVFSINNQVGGVIGASSSSNIENISSTGHIYSTGSNVGGFAGWTSGGLIHNVVAVTEVLGAVSTGGLIGSMQGGTELRHSHSKGIVKGTSRVGGLTGYITTVSTIISDCYSHVSVNASSDAGGLIGHHHYGVIYRSYSKGMVDCSGSNAGGLIGRLSFGQVFYCYWDIETSGQQNSAGGAGAMGRTTAQMHQEATYKPFNFYSLWRISEGHDYASFQDLSVYGPPEEVELSSLSGSGTESDPYIITDLNELNAIRQDLSAYYRLNNNIDMKSTVVWDFGRGWGSVGTTNDRFTGGFDGNSKTLTGLVISRLWESYQGMFGHTDGADIKDINLMTSYIKGAAYTGSLAGHTANSTIRNISAETCVFSINNQVGGVIGASSSSNIENISSTGHIYSTGSNVGGFAGWTSGGLIHNIVAVTEVLGAGSTGGLIGSMQGGTELRHSHSKGILKGTSRVGGLTGYITTVSTIISDCYSHVNVNASSDAGGLVGHHHYGVIYRSYSKGMVDCSGSNAGGLIGRLSWGSVYYCYWDIETSGQESSAGGAGAMGRTTAQMYQEATYKPFNFYSLWRINEGHDYACFKDLSAYGPPQEVELSSLSGSGTESDPYIITDLNELNAIRQDLGAYYILNNDIDMKHTVIWDFGRGWGPVGATDDRFTGVFDGNSKTLTGLVISRLWESYQGMFGHTDGADIKDINLMTSYIKGAAYTGSLAGHTANSTIRNISAETCVFSRNNQVGGVIGASSSSNIENISSTGHIYSTGNNAGGFAGWTNGGLIHNVVAVTEVFGAGSTGGLIGSMQGGTELRHSHSKGIVTGTSNVGGLAGYVTTSWTIISDCYSHADVNANSDAGGLVGHNHYGIIYRSYSKGMVDCSGSNAGGLIGRLSWGSVYYCYWDIETSGQESSAGGAGAMGRTTAQMYQKETYKPFNFYSLWRIHEGDYASFQDLSVYGPPQDIELSSLSGSGSESDPYIITNIDQLNAVRKDLGAYYRLNNDIDMRHTVVWDFGRGWGPLGATDDRFTGGFDGNSKTITGLVISRLWGNYQGMFGYIDGADIKDINLMTLYIKGAAYTGSLAGYAANSSIINISAESNIFSRNNQVGGLMGSSSSCSIENISSTGHIFSTGSNVGGFAGSTSGCIIHNVAVVTEVFGAGSTGGLIGSLHGGSKLKRSHSMGIVTGTSNVGGLAGYTTTSATLISDCYSHVNVNASSDAGGLVGHNHYGTINSSYSKGTVNCSGSNAGGLIGRLSWGIVNYSYWDIETSGQQSSAGGEGRNTDQMTFPHSQDTYMTWDFEQVWGIEAATNLGYPYLLCQDFDIYHSVVVYVEPYDLSVTLSGSGNYQEGDAVEISVSLNKGYIFSHWEGEHADILDDPMSETASFSMPGHDIVFTAVFEEDISPADEYFVGLYVDPEYLNVTLTGQGYYEEGETVYMNVILNKGYLFSHWEGEHYYLLDNTQSEATFFIMPDHDVYFIAVFMEEIIHAVPAVISLDNPSVRGIWRWQYNINEKSSYGKTVGKRSASWSWHSLISGHSAVKIIPGDINDNGYLEIVMNIPGLGLGYYSFASGSWTSLLSSCIDFTLAKANIDQPVQIIVSVAQGLYIYDISIPLWTRITSTPAEMMMTADVLRDGYGLHGLIATFSGLNNLYIYDFSEGRFDIIARTKPSQMVAGDLTGDGYDELICSFDGLGLYLFRYLPTKEWRMGLSSLASVSGGIYRNVPDNKGWHIQRITFGTPDDGHYMATGDIAFGHSNELILTIGGRTYYYSFEHGWNTLVFAPFKRIITGRFTGQAKDDLIVCESGKNHVYLRDTLEAKWYLLVNSGNASAMTTLE